MKTKNIVRFFLLSLTLTLAVIIFSSLYFAKCIPYATRESKDTLSEMDYSVLRAKIIREFPNAQPGHWGEFVKGVDEDITTTKKILALTFDACGTKLGDGYDSELIEFLRQEKLPATMFFTGLWIDDNVEVFKALSHDTLFLIENHGLKHRPCSVDGEIEYGIKGTLNVGQAVDEIELNNRKIKAITGKRPSFYRSATAFADETCVKVAAQLAMTTISYDVLSGDAIGGTNKEVIAKNILKNVHDGSIIIMHLNQPQWNTYESLRIVIPELRKQGYIFVKLDHHQLKSMVH